jgi:hypothetical protein
MDSHPPQVHLGGQKIEHTIFKSTLGTPQGGNEREAHCEVDMTTTTTPSRWEEGDFVGVAYIFNYSKVLWSTL